MARRGAGLGLAPMNRLHVYVRPVDEANGVAGVILISRDFLKAGHLPTLLSAFFYFDMSFMVWVLLGALAVQMSGDIGLNAAQKGFMVAAAGARRCPAACGVRHPRRSTEAAPRRHHRPAHRHRRARAAPGSSAFTLMPARWASAWFWALLAHRSPLPCRSRLAGIRRSIRAWRSASRALVTPALSSHRCSRPAWPRRHRLEQRARPRRRFRSWSRSPFICLPRKTAPRAPPPKKWAEYLAVLRMSDAWWFMFFYSVTFGGFVGLASSLADLLQHGVRTRCGEGRITSRRAACSSARWCDPSVARSRIASAASRR